MERDSEAESINQEINFQIETQYIARQVKSIFSSYNVLLFIFLISLAISSFYFAPKKIYITPNTLPVLSVHDLSTTLDVIAESMIKLKDRVLFLKNDSTLCMANQLLMEQKYNELIHEINASNLHQQRHRTMADNELKKIFLAYENSAIELKNLQEISSSEMVLYEDMSTLLDQNKINHEMLSELKLELSQLQERFNQLLKLNGYVTLIQDAAKSLLSYSVSMRTSLSELEYELIDLMKRNNESQTENTKCNQWVSQVNSTINATIEKYVTTQLQQMQPSMSEEDIESMIQTNFQLVQTELMQRQDQHRANVAENNEKKLKSYEEMLHNYSLTCQRNMELFVGQPKQSVSLVPSLDFALRSAGTKVVYELTSSTYFPTFYQMDEVLKDSLRSIGLTAWIDYVPKFSGESILKLFGMDYGLGSPEDAISSDMSLGSCWPMKGTSGMFTIQFPRAIKVESVSIDHIAIDQAIDITSGPKEFEVFGLESLVSPRRFLLKNSYNATENSPSTQTFEVPLETSNNLSFSYVTLRILNNHGNPEYTCLYRFRVHGRI